MVRRHGDRIEIVGPGRGFRLYELGTRRWVNEDVSGMLTAIIDNLPVLAPTAERAIKEARHRE
jgi:hypothetical protein